MYEKEFYLLGARVAEEELARAYKWLKRFDKSGLDRLKDQPWKGK